MFDVAARIGLRSWQLAAALALAAVIASPARGASLDDESTLTNASRAGGGIVDDVAASTPVGRVGRGPMTVQPGTNSPASIGGRDYTGHALDRMQQRGLVPSVVEDAITNGAATSGRVSGTTAHYSTVNNVTVITDTATGRVITTYPGSGKGF